MIFLFCLGRFLIDFIFCKLVETTVSGSPSAWGVSAVAILDCSLNVYACGRQKALTMPAYCVAANCNNSQLATQNITMHEFLRNHYSTTLIIGPEEHKDCTRNSPNTMFSFIPFPVVSEGNLLPTAISSAPPLESFQRRLGRRLHNMQPVLTSR